MLLWIAIVKWTIIKCKPAKKKQWNSVITNNWCLQSPRKQQIITLTCFISFSLFLIPSTSALSLAQREGKIEWWLQRLSHKNHKFYLLTLLRLCVKAYAKCPINYFYLLEYFLTYSGGDHTVLLTFDLKLLSSLVLANPVSFPSAKTGPLLCEQKMEKKSERSIHYATKITIRLGTLIGREGYPLEEC